MPSKRQEKGSGSLVLEQPEPVTPLAAGVDLGMAEKHYTVKEVACRLNLSAQSVYQMCSRRKLRHLRLGVGRGAVRVPASALDEMLADATIQPTHS